MHPTLPSLLHRGLLALVACATVAVVLAATAHEGAAQDRNARLDAGEVVIDLIPVKGSDMPKLQATAFVKAAPDKVWNLIEDCNRYTKTMKGLKSAKELQRKGDVIRCKTVADLPWPLSDLTAVTDAKHTIQKGKLYRRAWNLVSGDFHTNKGSWTLTPRKNGTLVVYAVHVEPKISVPDSVIAKAQKSAIPDLFEHIRAQVEGK